MNFLNLKSFGSKDYQKKNFSGLKIYVFGDYQELLYKSIFNSKITNKDYIKRAENEFRTDQFYWIAKFYKDLTKINLSLIIEDIKVDKNEESLRIFQHVILYFDNDNFNFNLIIEECFKNGNAYFPLFIIISKIKNEIMIDSRKRTKIINIVTEGISDQEIYMEIISALWECDCYYNERGNEICKYNASYFLNLFANNISFYTINVLIIGLYKAGKSAFINSLSNKLIAFESCMREYVTKKITEYYIYSQDGKRKNNFLKFIDTPGFTYDIDSNKKYLMLLEELLENKTKIIENEIHFIFFFSMEGMSLEGLDELFKLLNNCHKPVLFIINKSYDDSDDGNTKDINYIIYFFKQKKFLNLIDKKNYFGVNIIESKRVHIFGIEDIFKRMYKIYEEQNIFTQKELITHILEEFNSIQNNENKKKREYYCFKIILAQKLKYLKVLILIILL